jgi:hypothetical protein
MVFLSVIAAANGARPWTLSRLGGDTPPVSAGKSIGKRLLQVFPRHMGLKAFM